METTGDKCSTLPVATYHLLKEIQPHRESLITLITGGQIRDMQHTTVGVQSIILYSPNWPFGHCPTSFGTFAKEWWHSVGKLITDGSGQLACGCGNTPLTLVAVRISTKTWNDKRNKAELREKKKYEFLLKVNGKPKQQWRLPMGTPYQKVLILSEIRKFSLFESKTYKGLVWITLKFSRMHHLNSVFEAGLGASFVRADVLNPSCRDRISLHDMTDIPNASSTKLVVSGTIHFRLRICELNTHVTMSIVYSFCIQILLGTTLIDGAIRSIHPVETVIFPYFSPRVLISIAQKNGIVANGEENLDIRHSNIKDLAWFVLHTDSEVRSVTADHQVALKDKCESPVLVSMDAGCLQEIIMHYNAAERHACMMANGIRDVYLGLPLYIINANIGKVDAHLPKYQKVGEVENAQVEVVHVEEEHYSYPLVHIPTIVTAQFTLYTTGIYPTGSNECQNMTPIKRTTKKC